MNLMRRGLTRGIFPAALLGGIAHASQPYFQTGEDPKPAGQSWQVVRSLSDDFDDGVIDTSKWQLEPVGNGWNWIGRAPGLFRPENVSESEGSLKVTVSELNSPQVINGNTFTCQGAIVRSLNPGQAGWYFEARMKANATEMSSTFWLMAKENCEKKLETDIQECVGRTTELTLPWASKWDRIFHSNAIHRSTACNPTAVQVQGSKPTATPNHERFYVYGCWWKSTEELLFFLDGVYVYTIHPSTVWDREAFIQMAIETYDWNPVPSDGGMVKSGTLEQRTTQYDWVRVWKLTEGISVDAGVDQVVKLPAGDTVLAASVSDPGNTNSVRWDQISGPNTAILNGVADTTLHISGLVVGEYLFRFTATQLTGYSTSDEVVVLVEENSVPEIRSFRLPYAEAGSPYHFPVAVDSGNPPLTWTITAGALPPGLTLDRGIISGTPSGAGRSEATIRVLDADGDADVQSYTLLVAPQLPKTTLSIAPDEDAYIENSNTLNNSYLKVESGRRESYLKFHLAVASDPVKSAILSMRVSGDGGNGTIRFHKGTHSNWTESTLNASNKPAAGSEIGSLTATFTLNQTYEVDLTPMFVDSTEEYHTVIVKMDSGGNDVWFSSSEGGNSPSLAVSHQPVHDYSAWALAHSLRMPGSSLDPKSAFGTSFIPGNPANGFFYLFDASPLLDAAHVSSMLPCVTPDAITMNLPVEVPTDLTLMLESTDNLETPWQHSFLRNPDGTWPPPVVATDRGDGLQTLTLPLDHGPASFFRLRIEQKLTDESPTPESE